MTGPDPAPAPLARRIAAEIRATGPMRLDRYMELALADPRHGYYATRDPLGAQGDFVTAPEISQMFGEMIAVALAGAWVDQGRPRPVVLAELGPGRGTLMADMLRALAALPDLRTAIEVHLVETSPALRARQRERLGAQVHWHDRVGTLPEAPLLLVANEFFDALPIRQFRRESGGWRETLVGLGPGGALEPRLSGLLPPQLLPGHWHRTRPGDTVEICPAAKPIVEAIAARLARHGGAALIIDYGGEGGVGDTLQAVRAHRAVSPFEAPGEADLTAHVDFAALAEAARAAGCAATGPVGQGLFLERLGITARARQLAARLGGEALEQHVAAHRRLTHPAEMGTLFKVLALHPPGTPPPPGLAPLPGERPAPGGEAEGGAQR